jgi:hypothetical protein
MSGRADDRQAAAAVTHCVHAWLEPRPPALMTRSRPVDEEEVPECPERLGERMSRVSQRVTQLTGREQARQGQRRRSTFPRAIPSHRSSRPSCRGFMESVCTGTDET